MNYLITGIKLLLIVISGYLLYKLISHLTNRIRKNQYLSDYTGGRVESRREVN